MKKLFNSKLFFLFIAAVFALNQAAFLFIPYFSAQATTEEGYTTVTIIKPTNESVVSGQATIQVEVNTNMPDIIAELHWVSGSDNDYWTLKHESGQIYSIGWDTTTFTDGDYQLQAKVYSQLQCISCETEYYYSDTIIAKVKNSDPSSSDISVILRKPSDGTTVFGNIPVIAELNSTVVVDEVNFHWFGPANGEAAMARQSGGSEYQYDWDTTAIPDGKYSLEVSAVFNEQKYGSNQHTIAINNSGDSGTAVSVILEKPADGTTVSGQVDAYVRVDSAIVPDKVMLHWSNTETGMGQMSPAGNKNEYQYSWDTTAHADGKYELNARACIEEQDYYSNSITIELANDSANVVNPVDFHIKFVDTPGYISGPTVLQARTDMEVDEVIFDIYGPMSTSDVKNYKYTAVYQGDYNYSYEWDITGFPEGEYKTKALATKDGITVQAGMPIFIKYDLSGINSEEITGSGEYIPECGIKEVCSSDGVCQEVIKTYYNKQAIMDDGADFLYHGICKSDDIMSEEFAQMCEEEYEPVCGEVKICEGYYCQAEVRTFTNLCKLRINRGRLLYYGDCQEQETDADIAKIEEKSNLLVNDQLDSILAELQELRNIVQEQENEIKYLKSLVADLGAITEQMQASINNFITYGVDENTKHLGAGERAAVIHSYKSAFNKLPEDEDGLSDAIKIANGRWPSMRSEDAEERARNSFQEIYKRNPDTENENDNAAVTVMAYGLRQKAENRNLESENQGIKTFKHIYNKLPETTEEWNVMQAITYSGATR